eukprot:GILJ01003304.1.p1 GENE.GILJ01003304.1~~GILJ01003304.1.p1  ORF type:complete len:304 (+),score=47.33 GILJ01003304.1:181-1092(+)
MKASGLAFPPDVRNQGGRNEIVKRMNNHHQTLLNIKSTLNTQDRPKSAAPRRTGPKPHIDPFHEVREAYRRVGQVKGGTDTSAPKTFGMARALSDQKHRKLGKQRQEHHNNLAHMERRIQDYSSITERKKNPYDPEVYPSLLFRREEDVNKSVMHTSTRLTPRPRTASRSRGSVNASIEDRPSVKGASVHINDEDNDYEEEYIDSYMAPVITNVAARPQSAQASIYPTEQKPVVISNGHTASAAAKDPYHQLKKELVHAIVSKRLYKDSDLNFLFDNARLKTGHLEADRVEEVISSLRSELEL